MRDTVNFSMYSDMSSRIMALSSPKSAWARALHSSVLPTPVGPRKRKEPMGRLGSLRPERARRMARDTALMASCCPMTRLCRVSSRCRSFSDSFSLSRWAGMPVHRATTSAMSSPVTWPLMARRFSSQASFSAFSFWDRRSSLERRVAAFS